MRTDTITFKLAPHGSAEVKLIMAEVNLAE
jgi:hypothetical protein